MKKSWKSVSIISVIITFSLVLYIIHPYIYVRLLKFPDLDKYMWYTDEIQYDNTHFSKRIQDYQNFANEYNYTLPYMGEIIDSKTAIKHMKNILYANIGKRMTEYEAPFQAELINDTYWIVRGTESKIWDDDTYVMIFNKSDGKLMSISETGCVDKLVLLPKYYK